MHQLVVHAPTSPLGRVHSRSSPCAAGWGVPARPRSPRPHTASALALRPRRATFPRALARSYALVLVVMLCGMLLRDGSPSVP
jgi:hypothetical protein|eukprot:COSAG06_NODE_653_length_13364_cov_3.847041_3_plen_83_part_00